MTDFRALCAELVNELAAWQQADDLYSDGGTIRGDADYDLVTRASAALDEPEEGPSDQELYDLWDKEAEYFALYGEAWRFAHAVLARWGRPAVPRASDGPTDDDLRAQIMLWLGCTDLPSDDQELPDPLCVPELLDLLSATLARWGLPAPAPKPIPVSERPWERDGWRDTEGRCWFCYACSIGRWFYQLPPDPEQDWGMLGTEAHCLPHWAIARPRPEAKEPT